MGTRGRRDELIALVALLVISAAIAIGGAISQSDDGGVPDATASSPAARPSTPAPEPEEPEETGVQIGDQPFVYACQLLPHADVQRIFGSLGPQSRVRQQYLDRTPTDEELVVAATLAYGGVTTECRYGFDDPDGHTLEVAVTQFPDERLVDRRWSQLRRASGRQVAGSDGQMLYLRAQRSFVVRGADFITEVRYSTLGDTLRTKPLTAKELAAQLPRMRRAATAIGRHVIDGMAVVAPQSVSAGLPATLGGTPYVAPCSVLDPAAFEALGGPPSGPVVVDTSILKPDPSVGAAVSSCERSGSVPDGDGTSSTFATLEVTVTVSPATAQRVLQQHLTERYPRGTTITELQTDVGTAYVAEVGATKKWPWRTRSVHVVVGPYELQLAAVRDVGPTHPQGVPVTDEQLSAVVTEMAQALTP